MESSYGCLLIRTDADSSTGSGHLMRCVALAERWKAGGGRVVFVTACESDALRQRLLDEGFEIAVLERSYPHPEDWLCTSRILVENSVGWVVLDGYHFDELYQLKVKEAGARLLVIDDTAHLRHYHADVLLNQNIGAEGCRYSCEPHARLLLGVRHVLLRSQFLAWQGWHREIPPEARRFLVTLGGGDARGVTAEAIRALECVDVDGLEVTVVVGAGNPRFREIESAARHAAFAVRLLRDATSMPELMASADIAVSAGGITSWELAFMGLPAAVCVLAENQRGTAAALGARGIALDLGWHTEMSISEMAGKLSGLARDRSMRLMMSQRGRQLVDGMGADRVVQVLLVESHRDPVRN